VAYNTAGRTTRDGYLLKAMKARIRNWILFPVFTGLSVVAAIGLYDSFGPDEFVFRKEIRRGNQIISKIDAFHSTHGRFPASMQEVGVGFPDADRFFYEQCDQDRFVVWFGTRLGESMTYDSFVKRWKPVNVACTAAP
jgi:hypothetical protein